MSIQTMERIIIPGNGEPIGSKNYRFKEHLDDTDICWSPLTIHLFQHERAKNPRIKTMHGADFVTYAMADKHLVNANAADYVNAYPEYYFEEWKPLIDGKFRTVFFCGSLFVDGTGDLAVVGLQWDPKTSQLQRIYRSLKADFGINCFAVSAFPY